ncbi:MAG: hypothetical protein PWP65_156 [Clostridia bacterium]|nr:hypothetical protein [Clostridia bacterium]
MGLNNPVQLCVTLVGNPNTGKSTIFNALTGLRQHTGNWPGKTVLTARGVYHYKGREFLLIDLPGTYSLVANSPEERVARDFLFFGHPDATVVVADATCLERNLNLALQVMEITSRVIVCVNLIDEARKKNLNINIAVLARELGVPVVATAARTGQGLDELKDLIYAVACGYITPCPREIGYGHYIEERLQKLLPLIQPYVSERRQARWLALRLLEGDESLLETWANKHLRDDSYD